MTRLLRSLFLAPPIALSTLLFKVFVAFYKPEMPPTLLAEPDYIFRLQDTMGLFIVLPTIVDMLVELWLLRREAKAYEWCVQTRRWNPRARVGRKDAMRLLQSQDNLLEW
ncbi:hypothetical protein BCR34DRAFT_555216 [Clohesyomyces aquaticus]|uniref:Uncharacterized protein n=1 Tax=Clohesyomyces aquaticus TaxID=1231657 RepID=A0A1Y2A535_9PLEO|nr:hypothetical protein BCR34DRAFT_555216 [Clohesyomyces aquaticus]